MTYLNGESDIFLHIFDIGDGFHVSGQVAQTTAEHAIYFVMIAREVEFVGDGLQRWMLRLALHRGENKFNTFLMILVLYFRVG